MTTWDELDDATVDLVFFTVDYALDNARRDKDGFTPFTLIGDQEGRRGLSRFVSEGELAEGIEAGRRSLEYVPAGTVAVTLAWDGFIHDDRSRTEAVLVEAYQIGMKRGVRVAQPYERTPDGLRQTDKLTILDDTEPLTLGTVEPGSVG
jgi:hypothetical protein